jgi:hypothetical protein
MGPKVKENTQNIANNKPNNKEGLAKMVLKVKVPAG